MELLFTKATLRCLYDAKLFKSRYLEEIKKKIHTHDLKMALIDMFFCTNFKDTNKKLFEAFKNMIIMQVD